MYQVLGIKRTVGMLTSDRTVHGGVRVVVVVPGIV